MYSLLLFLCPLNLYSVSILQTLRDARHCDHCTKVKGKILKCNECDNTFTTQDLIMMNINHWRRSSKSDGSLEEPLTWSQLDSAWLDIAAARYPYETFGEGGNEGSASSWLFTADEGRSAGHLYKNKARHTFLHLFYDEHDHRHRKT